MKTEPQQPVIALALIGQGEVAWAIVAEPSSVSCPDCNHKLRVVPVRAPIVPDAKPTPFETMRALLVIGLSLTGYCLVLERFVTWLCHL